MPIYGATVGFGIEVEAETEKEGVTKILDEARQVLGNDYDPFIVQMDEEEEEQ